MRKTRLVLIPGVKSLDTIGCLLLFLACPTIAFKGQENREVDTICKAQNLKEFWVDSPWPGDTDNIGWVRGYGGGTWPGNSLEHTCNGMSSRSVVRSRMSDDRRVQARREVSRDDGIGSRKIRLDNDMRRDTRSNMIDSRTDSRNFRRVAPYEERRTDTPRVDKTGFRASRSSDREIRSGRRVRELDSRRESFARDGRDVRMRTTDQRTVTTREQIDGRRNTKTPSRNAEREIRKNPEVRDSGNRRAAERLTVRNREVIDVRRDPMVSIRSQQDKKSFRRIRDLTSRAFRRADSRTSDEFEGRTVDSTRHEGERTRTNLATRSLEREIRSEKDVGELVNRRDSRSRANQRMARERNLEKRVMNTRDADESRVGSGLEVRRTAASDKDIRNEPKRRALARERARYREVDERRSDERYNVDNRRASVDRRDYSHRNQRLSTRSERHIRDVESQARDWTPGRRTISNREVIDGRRLSIQSLNRGVRYDRVVREPDSSQTVRSRRSSSMRLYEENGTENRRDGRLSTRSLDRQIVSKREAPEEEHRGMRGSFTKRVIDNFRSAEGRRSSRRERSEGTREFRPSVGAKHDTKSVSRSSEERRIDNSRLTTEKSYSRLPTRSITREVRVEREFPKNSLSFQARDSRRSLSGRANMNRVDSEITIRTEVEKESENVRASPRSVPRRVSDAQRADRRVRGETLVRLQRSTPSIEDRAVRIADLGRGTRRFESRREVERDNSREGRNSNRFVLATERRNDHNRDQYPSSQRHQVLSRSSKGIRQDERRMRLVRAEREPRQWDTRRTVREREIQLTRSPERNSRGFSGVERTEINLVRDKSRSELLAMHVHDVRSIGDSGRTRRADNRQSNRIVENRRSSIDKETTIRASRERSSLLAANPERVDERRVRDDTRLGSRSLRETQSQDGRRFGDQMRVTQNNREISRLDRRHTVSQDESQLRRSPHKREIRAVEERRFERESRRERREDNAIRRQRLLAAANFRQMNSKDALEPEIGTRLLQEARSREDIRRFDRKIPNAQTQRETSQSDTRRHLVRATLKRTDLLARTEKSYRLSRDDSKSHERAANERRSTESRQERRENQENRQRRLISTDVRQINVRDVRENEVRRISRDVTLKFKLRAIPDEARRSERQRRVDEDSVRFMDKRHGDDLPSGYIRRFSKFTDERQRMMDSRKTGKNSEMKSVFGQELSNEEENVSIESSKNALRNWLATDISRIDLKGIAETLIYGGIACFTLFSHVNKKVIF